MFMSRKWWEPAAQDDLHDGEGQARHSFDLGDLMSLGMNGGEFTASHLAALLACSTTSGTRRTTSGEVMRRNPSGGKRIVKERRHRSVVPLREFPKLLNDAQRFVELRDEPPVIGDLIRIKPRPT